MEAAISSLLFKSHPLGEVIDRVLDRGIVIDAAFRFSVAGVHLMAPGRHLSIIEAVELAGLV